MKKSLIAISSILILGVSCTTQEKFEKRLTDTLESNPEILTKLIENNPDKFIIAFQNAARNGQQKLAQRKKLEEQKKLEASFNKPLIPVLRKDELIRGTRNAPITIVEYSDFECPFCSRGFSTVKTLLKKYEGKVQFVYKHLPLSFHPSAMIAAKYYEALRIQNDDLAIKFHDEIFKNQRKLKSGEKFLSALAKKLGADMKKLTKDINSKAVSDRIAADMKEAAKFGMSGTPGFLLNGVPIRGAYPASKFEEIISELKNRGKLKI
ncbi:thiol:disulfide interchange protein [Halobacteriovorax marinus]|uniref:Thiol:disulfide interchange protein n=1 Tax=Halobacteriovorax marinus TaxID=97084 RepID=A0A1Y5F8I7_9BACT|nr:thiol:disulfide interchange protein [Halobacteriovorax marinus]